jgi:hypothetical protein
MALTTPPRRRREETGRVKLISTIPHYRCVNNHIFLADEAGTQTLTATLSEPAEHYDICPVCGSEDLEEVEVCEVCGEVVESGLPHVHNSKTRKANPDMGLADKSFNLDDDTDADLDMPGNPNDYGDG